LKKTDKAVFLDRDGVICENVEYMSRPSQLKIIPKVPEAIKLLNENGFRVVVVTNQSGIARGYLTEKDLEKIHKKMIKILDKNGAKIDSIYYCPHLPDGVIKKYRKECNCRKPKPGMLIRAEKELSLDLKKSFMVGDSMSDIQAGKKVDCMSILISNSENKDENGEIKPDFVASNLLEAVNFILCHST